MLFADPYAKLCYMAELVCAHEQAGRGVAYIDLDTMFSAYFQAGLVRTKGAVDIYLPVEGRFMPLFKEVIAGMKGRSLVVFDSVNSFYTMYYNSYFKKQGQRAGGNVNHLLSVLLMLLVRQGVTEGVPVVTTSMLRYRSSSGGSGGAWKQSPASRRLLQSKSATRTSIDLVGGEIVQRVLAHETLGEGTVLSYPVTALG